MVQIEGYSPEQLLALPPEQIEALVLTGDPLVFRAGSAQVLGEFRMEPDRLVIELAQIEGGGEGVLIALWRLAEQFAARRGLSHVEWIVHAVHCAHPILKLRRVLERRGCVVRDVPGTGSAYHRVHPVPPSA